MRTAREALGLSIRDVAEATGLSVSMVSLVERGKTSPSVGTLVSIADALGLSMAQLFASGAEPASPVIRRAEQRQHPTVDGMTRRLVLTEPSLGIEISEHEYQPAGKSGSVATHHTGYECGLVLSGALTIEVDGDQHVLETGDAIRFPSTSPHRFVNTSSSPSRAVWVNLRIWPEGASREVTAGVSHPRVRR